MTLARISVLLTLLAACGDKKATRPQPSDRVAPATTTVPWTPRLLGEPIRASRAWSTALAPNARGGWNFITQTYESGSDVPTEFVVVDLETGRQKLTKGPAKIYTNSNYQVTDQVRAPNGRIFLPAYDSYLAYYEPADETVKFVGKIGTTEETLIFRLAFGPDGKLYGGTQSNGRPLVFQIDPDTLVVKLLGNVGRDRRGYSYAYYLAADPPWIYVTVGQTPWELVALNMKTGEQRVLATRDDDGFMQLETRPEGIVARLISNARTSAPRNEFVWCVDGALQPVKPGGKLAFKPHDVAPRDGVVRNGPELDLARVNPDSLGEGRVRWRKRDGAWKETKFKVEHTSAVELESLLALPDGTLLGNAKQYHGFFRYDPKTSAFTRYGGYGVSGGPRVIVGGLVYFSGYPNGALHVYDPTRPWSTSKTDAAPNPRQLGAFTAAGAHYGYFLVPSKNGRIYYAGRRERTGTGGGVGSYTPATKMFAGHHDQLSTLVPRGLAVLDQMQRVIYSGEVMNDPATGAQAHEAELVVYDYDLREIERHQIRPGIRSTGQLFTTNEPTIVIGLLVEERALYRYDLAAKTMLDWVELDGIPSAATQRASDGSIWIIVDGDLLRIDPGTLEIKKVNRLTDVPTGPGLLEWQTRRLFWATGSQLHEIEAPDE